MASPLSAGPLPPVDGGTEGGRRQRDDEAISLISRDGFVAPPSAGLLATTWFGDISKYDLIFPGPPEVIPTPPGFSGRTFRLDNSTPVGQYSDIGARRCGLL